MTSQHVLYTYARRTLQGGYVSGSMEIARNKHVSHVATVHGSGCEGTFKQQTNKQTKNPPIYFK